MSKPIRNHFSPVFTNSEWAEDGQYCCWNRGNEKGIIGRESVGRKKWGQQKKLYSTRVEHALGRELETPASAIYRDLIQLQEPNLSERNKWAQFLRSQIVRTPLFMRYEASARMLHGIEGEPSHDRVGCETCGDLTEITGRHWLLLMTHPDDWLVRTDSPVFCTGFLNDPNTALYYPLTPRLCFVATSMRADWNPELCAESPPPMGGLELQKGDAHFLNFYFAKAADESLILRPSDSGNIDQAMFTEVLGIHPQPPFDLHHPHEDELTDAYESIRILMSVVDGMEYPKFCADEVSEWCRPAEDDEIGV